MLVWGLFCSVCLRLLYCLFCFACVWLVMFVDYSCVHVYCCCLCRLCWFSSLGIICSVTLFCFRVCLAVLVVLFMFYCLDWGLFVNLFIELLMCLVRLLLDNCCLLAWFVLCMIVCWFVSCYFTLCFCGILFLFVLLDVAYSFFVFLWFACFAVIVCLNFILLALAWDVYVWFWLLCILCWGVGVIVVCLLVVVGFGLFG